MDSYHAACPADATGKGFYFAAFVREAVSNGHHLEGFGPYREFKDYPLKEAIRLVAECARRVYPDEPLREGIRRIGWSVFPTLLSTVLGKVLFGALGQNIPAVISMSPRGFEVSLNRGRSEILRVTDRDAEVHVSDFYLFPDCFLAGVFEGMFAHYGKEAQVEVRKVGKGTCGFHVRW